MDYIRRYYKVPAKRGGKVLFKGQQGKITGHYGPYLRIRLEGQRRSGIFHPTWEIEYQ